MTLSLSLISPSPAIFVFQESASSNLLLHGFGHNLYTKKSPPRRTFGPYKGVRMRNWGKWVSEIRVPKTGERIWLGSYDAPEKAARAYDAAQYCIRGERGRFNFPADERPVLPQGSMASLSKKDIQEIATKFASSVSDVSASASCSSLVSSASPEVEPSENPAPPNVLVCRGRDDAYESVGDSFAPTSVTAATASSPESLELEDFLMLDTEWMDELI